MNTTTSTHSSMEALISSQIANQLSSQIANDGSQLGSASEGPQHIRTPSKSRSFSESFPKLSPSPKFREPRRESKDDHSLNEGPKTPRRPEVLARGLSLQMPPKDSGMPSPAQLNARAAPLSPQLDRTHTYGSPVHLLPRRSRGAEFSRACTNLHHSTLAEQSSPDSSPTITQKAMAIPQRKSRTSSFMSDVNVFHNGNAWSNTGEKTAISSSVGSINMLGSDSDSSSSDVEDSVDPEEQDDPMLMTPQVQKSSHNIPPAFGGPLVSAQSPGGWPNTFTPGTTFMNMQRARLRKARSRKSSSSASGRSSLNSPGPGSPPQSRGGAENSGGYFAALKQAKSRRESLSLHTNDLHISSSNDSGDEAGASMPTTPGVVQRPVTRRGNLLPKSRAFGRIKAELLEESAPVDMEFKREAEIIRQVRESDETIHPSTTHSSPSLLPTSGIAESLEDIPEADDLGLSESNASTNTTKGLFGTFGPLAFPPRSAWTDTPSTHTPPPQFLPRHSSSAMSDDITMDSPSASTASLRGPDAASRQSSFSRGGTPQPQSQPQSQAIPPTAADGLKKSNKRRRDDDLDANSIKRRAVSPGVSVHNSPTVSQSPGQRDGLWGPQKSSRENSVSGHAAGERSGSSSGLAMTPTMGPKRVGLQGMTDTNDGLMKMSIE